jgi:hypothetical protein
MPLSRIISGGQTGADRAGLDAANEAGFPVGGWCPKGRLAEDGVIPGSYPLLEMPQAGYRARTIRNVEEGDGTVIFYFSWLSGGTELTLLQCIRLEKPYQLIDANEVSPRRAGDMLRNFVREFGIEVLNVAGPRESGAPGTYRYVYDAMEAALQGEKSGLRQ